MGKGTVCIRLKGWLFKAVDAQLTWVPGVFELRPWQGALVFPGAEICTVGRQLGGSRLSGLSLSNLSNYGGATTAGELPGFDFDCLSECEDQLPGG